MDASTGRVQDWVAELVEIEQVPALAMRYRAAHAAKQLAFDAPWTEAILRALETPSYAALAQHEASWISQLLGLSEPEIRRCLDLLDQAGLVRWNGTRYAELKPLTVDTRGGKGALHALKAHWARVAAQRAAEPRKGDLFAYNVMSAATADLERIRALLGEVYREIRAIVAASEPPERVALLNLQLLHWDAAHPLVR
ncbi:MAG TPA: DUF4423 domain-containing protein [Polyangiaceae bacterium]|nr:DUF4423 domain-containing protein [Polyangiaceae bacterium]